MQILFHESHRITDPYTLSLSSFYILHYIIIITSCVAIPSPKLVHSNIFSFSTYMKTFHVCRNLSDDSQGRRADILAAHWYSVIHSTIIFFLTKKTRINFPQKDFKVFVPRVGLVSYNFSFMAGPIKNEYLTKILEYLFPDSSSTSDHAYPREFERAQSLEGVSTIGIKSAPVDGLVWRLTVVLVSML